jgi:hypothetical protein
MTAPLKICERPSCYCVFRSEDALNKHLGGPITARVCVDPFSLGMVRDGYNRWMFPWPRQRAELLRRERMA